MWLNWEFPGLMSNQCMVIPVKAKVQPNYQLPFYTTLESLFQVSHLHVIHSKPQSLGDYRKLCII